MPVNGSAESSSIAYNITVQGTVQGVGFRPFVFRLANELELAGTVTNNGDGVHIHIGGSEPIVKEFCSRLTSDAPPIAHIVSLDIHSSLLPPARNLFIILPSDKTSKSLTQIAPDIATCRACIEEINNATDRRFGYPFTNCTNCGPRFTIVKRVPYDRPNTSMAPFPLCTDCSKEYNDPSDRRFHAQPNACPHCGPQLSWLNNKGKGIDTDDHIAAAARALSDGFIVAIKGLGGFHLAVDASSDQAVSLLRKRKRRKAKPLAVMVKDIATITSFCTVSSQEKELLLSSQQPIVLLNKKKTEQLAADLAPEIGVLGVMLPYTPLHHLLLNHEKAPKALVMTSGNLSNEPICTDNKEALTRLSSIADFYLVHNREILTRVDDSVIRMMAGKARLIRRARGYAPSPLLLKKKTTDILGCGAEMKNSFCIVRNQEAYLSQHIGELTSSQSLDFYTESVEHLQGVLDIVPDHVACDMHPDYLSTRYARNRNTVIIPVQHHHAHAAAVMAEHHLDGQTLAVILDGTGFGGDDTIFGGEVYLASRHDYQRLARLSHLLLPGGDMAAKEPWRMALSLLHAAASEKGVTISHLPDTLRAIPKAKKKIILQMLDKNVNSPKSSSCGRLFDAIAGVLGLCLYSDYEGQAAMMLEHQAQKGATTPEAGRTYPVRLQNQGSQTIIDSSTLVREIRRDDNNDTAKPLIAFRFHQWLIQAITLVLETQRNVTGINTVILSGGCMQNKLLLEGFFTQLTKRNFTVYSGEMVPVNDGGISLGQAYIGGVEKCA